MGGSDTVLLSETVSPHRILFICETTPFAKANHLSKTFQFCLPKVGNYQSPAHVPPSTDISTFAGGGGGGRASKVGGRVRTKGI